MTFQVAMQTLAFGIFYVAAPAVIILSLADTISKLK